MGWKLWSKKESQAVEKLPKPSKPKDLPSPVGRALVVEMHQNPDWVWHLRCVMQPHGTDENAFNLRVFDPAQALKKSVEIKNFSTLDSHPDLVLYSGVFKKKENLFQILKTAA